MLKKIIFCLLAGALVILAVCLCLPETIKHTFSVKATVENVSVYKGDANNPIIPNEEKHIENFMRVSGLSKSSAMDIVNNPEKYLYIVCSVNIENKGDVKLLLKEPAKDVFNEEDIWLLSEIEGYQELLPNTTEKADIYLVAKNTAENQRFNSSIPITVEYNDKILFKEIKNSATVWAQESK